MEPGIFFDVSNPKDLDIIKKSESITLGYDNWLYFYLMLPEDVKRDRVETVNNMIKKLGKYDEFSYLNSDIYKPKYNEKKWWSFTNTFNIRWDYKNLAKNSSLDKESLFEFLYLLMLISVRYLIKEFYEAATKRYKIY